MEIIIAHLRPQILLSFEAAIVRHIKLFVFRQVLDLLIQKIYLDRDEYIVID